MSSCQPLDTMPGLVYPEGTNTDETESNMSKPKPELILTLDGGIVQDAVMSDGSPIPFAIEVRDYDTEGLDPADLETDADGDQYYATGL